MRLPKVTIGLLLCAVGLLSGQSGKDEVGSTGVMQEQKAGFAKATATDSNVATVQIPLDDKLRRQIASAVSNPEQPKSVQVRVQGVAPPSTATDEKTALMVFVNKPDASGKTSEKDPHFVGAVDFQPTTDRKAQNFLLDAGPALAELARTKQLDLQKPITVSVVKSGDAQQAEKVKIDSVQVLVPKAK